MIPYSTLTVFVGAVLLLLMSPGPNMAFVLAHGASYGWRGGAAAALGIGAADLVLTALTAAGITAIVMQWSYAFDLIRFTGVLYLMWMAWMALKRSVSVVTPSAIQTSLWSVFLRAMLNSLLNPKALLFFMVFLPQFVEANATSVMNQVVCLGVVLTIIAVSFHLVLGSLGGAIQRRVSRLQGVAHWQSRGLAVVLFLLALRLALSSRPR
ncbi:lysine transporter LysE [Rhodoferax lacus]|uniref:Lysine transporter LysE n=1 Tax=Rhodoferax lacus TaxID=2184758 RepID=A0A3E1RDI0_9BURK|nr:LysE family translocator [Rhodoferax lacus]RFO96660.1 lysine transporter LysE [Rhodoferax lacus]